MRLSLQSGVADAIRRHGIETYPDECCGALIGREGVVTGTYALPNTTEEGPRRRFRVRPQDYREAERRATESGADLLGFYGATGRVALRGSPGTGACAHLEIPILVAAHQATA